MDMVAVHSDKNVDMKTHILDLTHDDEWVFAKVPIEYQYLFEALLNKMSTWGQELLDDCTASCRGNNKNISIP